MNTIKKEKKHQTNKNQIYSIHIIWAINEQMAKIYVLLFEWNSIIICVNIQFCWHKFNVSVASGILNIAEKHKS